MELLTKILRRPRKPAYRNASVVGYLGFFRHARYHCLQHLKPRWPTTTATKPSAAQAACAPTLIAIRRLQPALPAISEAPFAPWGVQLAHQAVGRVLRVSRLGKGDVRADAARFDATNDAQWADCVRAWLPALSHPSALRVDAQAAAVILERYLRGGELCFDPS